MAVGHRAVAIVRQGRAWGGLATDAPDVAIPALVGEVNIEVEIEVLHAQWCIGISYRASIALLMTFSPFGGGLDHDGGNYSGKAEANQGAITGKQVDSRPKSHNRRNRAAYRSP